MFVIFIFFNFLSFLSAIGILCCSIYLFAKTKDANVFNICFLVISLLLLCFTLLAFKLRRSVHLLGLYLFVLIIIFLFLLIITIILMVNKDKLIEWARKNMKDSEESIDEAERNLKENIS